MLYLLCYCIYMSLLWLQSALVWVCAMTWYDGETGNIRDIISNITHTKYSSSLLTIFARNWGHVLGVFIDSRERFMICTMPSYFQDARSLQSDENKPLLSMKINHQRRPPASKKCLYTVFTIITLDSVGASMITGHCWSPIGAGLESSEHRYDQHSSELWRCRLHINISLWRITVGLLLSNTQF